MLEYWNSRRGHGKQSGGTRSVASGHDEAWPSKYMIPSFPYSNIPVKF
jgi:hypothetical protein